MRSAGRTLIVVLMGAVRSAQRAADAANVARWLSHEEASPAMTQAAAAPRAAKKLRRARGEVKTLAIETTRREADPGVATLGAADGS